MHAKTRTIEAELLLYCTSVVYIDGQSGRLPPYHQELDCMLNLK